MPSFQYMSFRNVETYSKSNCGDLNSSCNQTFKCWFHPLEEFEAGVLFLISSRQITCILEPGFLPFHYSASLSGSGSRNLCKVQVPAVTFIDTNEIWNIRSDKRQVKIKPNHMSLGILYYEM